MKQMIISLFAVCLAMFTCSSVNAQENQPNDYYIEIYEIAVLGSKSVAVNFGLETKSMSTVYKVVDDDNKPIEFKNAIAAINYLHRRGWEVVTVYDRNMGSAGTRTFYLLRLDADKYGKDKLADAIDEALKEY